MHRINSSSKTLCLGLRASALNISKYPQPQPKEITQNWMIHRTERTDRYNYTWSHSVNSISTQITSSPYTISTHWTFFWCLLSISRIGLSLFGKTKKKRIPPLHFHPKESTYCTIGCSGYSVNQNLTLGTPLTPQDNP